MERLAGTKGAQRPENAAMYHTAGAFDKHGWLLPHIVVDPLQHNANEGILVEVRNEALA